MPVYEAKSSGLPSQCRQSPDKPISSIHDYPTRQSVNENLFIKSIRTTQYGIRSLHFTGSHLWNSLPNTIKQITSFSRFRKTLKKKFTDGYNNNISS